MKIVPEEFGKLVFNENAMRKALSKEVFDKLEQTIKNGESLDSSLAHKVAEAMKDWAIANGATHYTHWFQPLTGITAEKHESFLTNVESGNPVLELSGKELIKGEPDASSFPSGGLRSTFEARGYTAWDPTSYAFIKDHTLCIPTAFCSYGGHALDKKTPLLRSIDALNKEALRVFKALKMNDVKHIVTNVGPEQEYFLVDKALFEKRLDLILTGRTLYGAPAPKGQELDDHYFGVIKPRVQAFMEEVDRELWKLGISAKTEHNEVAPAQHELANIYTTCNLACDQNQLVMEIMTKVADKHHFVILFHEKPFDGVNGSGKHNNWSISTDTGINLLHPGDTPFENRVFLLFLAAVIIEGFIHFDYEITLLTVRHANGTTFLQPIGHHQVDGDYRESWQPQAMTSEALQQAQHIAKMVTDALGGYGIFGVEMFIQGNKVIFSEVSPRPHDTGMVTMISQDLSEFALHARAVLGLPIPEIRFFQPSASKAIVIEGEGTEVTFEGIDKALSIPGVQLRLFGKPEVHGHRRYGVVLATDESVEKALAKAEKAYKCISYKVKQS